MFAVEYVYTSVSPFDSWVLVPLPCAANPMNVSDSPPRLCIQYENIYSSILFSTLDNIQSINKYYLKPRLCMNSGCCLPTLAIFDSFCTILMSLDRACWIATVRLFVSAAVRPRAPLSTCTTVAVNVTHQTISNQSIKTTAYPYDYDPSNSKGHACHAVDHKSAALLRLSCAHAPDIGLTAHNANPTDTDHISYRNLYSL